MLEPQEECDLACMGCGRIREYERVLNSMLTVQQSLDAVEQSGAPIVSIAGGEPTLHPQMDEIVNRITATRKFVYTCTDALLMERAMVSPCYKYEAVPDQQMFVSRQKARATFKNVLDARRNIRLYNNPLYLDFLRGEREYQ